MKVQFSEQSWKQYHYWRENDAKLFDKLNNLITECSRSPFEGSGKPEPLGGNLSGWWSRRLNLEHRLVYCVNGSGDEQVLQIALCRYHY